MRCGRTMGARRDGRCVLCNDAMHGQGSSEVGAYASTELAMYRHNAFLSFTSRFLVAGSDRPQMHSTPVSDPLSTQFLRIALPEHRTTTKVGLIRKGQTESCDQKVRAARIRRACGKAPGVHEREILHGAAFLLLSNGMLFYRVCRGLAVGMTHAVHPTPL